MKKNKNSLDSLLQKEKNISETPLFNENELASILGEKQALPNKTSITSKLKGVLAMFALTSVFSIIALVLQFNATSDGDAKNKSSARSHKSEKDTVIIQFMDKPETNGMLLKSENAEFKGISLMELSERELAEIGVFKDNRGITYYLQSKESMKISSIGIGRSDSAVATKLTVSMNGLVLYPDHNVVKKAWLRFNPRMVTDDLGMKRLSRFDEEKIAPELAEKIKIERKKLESNDDYDETKLNEYEGEMEKLVEKEYTTSNLIPVLVRTGKIYSDDDKKNQRWRPDCIFWYDATPEFIAALPDRFKNQIAFEQKAVEVLAEKTETAIKIVAPLPSPQQVLKELQRTENKVIPQEVLVPEKEKRETGNSYFDVWRSASGAIINTQIFPNPVRDQHPTVKFTLKETRNVIITLHDIYGRRITELSRSTPFKGGEHSQEILLKDVQPGIYLVAIQTDRGEQAVQRIIVEQ
ncbi:MAG TPA: T9SS type A sorting domain-containing protein [Patescibacteria group bacterium]|nr:T9SS type A sorting domain-containing protein [Patescibacteria group bacterium]